MIDFLKKHSERAALIGLGVGFLFFVGGGLYMQKQNQQDKKEVKVEPEIKKVELKVRQGKGSSDGKNEAKTGPQNTSSFFLKPSPGELLEQLSSMETLREDVAQKKFISLRVLWPVFFFNIEELDTGITASFDVSEDGFGVVVKTEINLTAYPEINNLSPGDKIWLGGEIVGVDLSGTGTIILKTEHLALKLETKNMDKEQEVN